MDDSERPSKQEVFLTMLSEGWVSLHLDARRQGVVVPAPFSSQAHMVLQYGRSMPVPIPDLEVTAAGVSASLSFSRVPHRTYVPWSAVYVIACTNACGVTYREDVPADLLEFGEGAETFVPPPTASQVSCAKDLPIDEPWLRSVPAEAEEEIEANGMVMHNPRRRRPQLRVVK
ncbi:MAG TPA: ClpXP protease specificity-enhancing factor SspB [Polyangia bacterium]